MFYLSVYHATGGTYYEPVLYMFYTVRQAKSKYRKDYKLQGKKLIWSVQHA